MSTLVCDITPLICIVSPPVGPDGGDGGNGGHVLARATDKCSNLTHVARVLRGQRGVDGRTKCRHGKNADHTYISVCKFIVCQLYYLILVIGNHSSILALNEVCNKDHNL